MIFSPKTINLIPETPGVYKFKNHVNKIIYIGKAKNLRKRVSQYFQNKRIQSLKTQLMVKQVKNIEIKTVSHEFEALLLEVNLIKIFQPKYNVIWKDGKNYIYIKITNDEFPRVYLSRKDDEPNTIQFGPFPSARITRDVLRNIRQIIPFCQQKTSVGKSCFYTHLGLCNPCPGDIIKFSGETYDHEKKIYQKNIQEIKKLLNGKIIILKKYFLREMNYYSRNNKFEEAKVYRDRLRNLEFYLLNRPARVSAWSLPYNLNQSWKNEKKELITILPKRYSNINNLRRIECFDISHTSGEEIVGSMVTFIDNFPEKNLYRKFKIKIQKRIDDLSALKEIFSRRLSHKEWGLSDLIIVDGGTPQVRTFQKVASSLNINIPIIGIAKNPDVIVVPENDGFDRIYLPQESKALHLIQRIRDEAHRFAHKYHSLLRLKSYKNVEKRL